VAITGLMEVILYVQDMATQVAFYRDTLGLKVRFPTGDQNLAGESWVTLDSGACVLALHAGGQRRLGKDSPKIVFAVDDIQATRTHLMSLGLAMGDVRSPAPGVWVSDALDPEGNPLSIEGHRSAD